METEITTAASPWVVLGYSTGMIDGINTHDSAGSVGED